MQDWKEKRETLRHYDQQAKIYNNQYVEEQNLKIESILKKLKINPDDFILDLGCGTGFLFPYLKKFGFLVGLDSSRNSLKLAKKRTKNTKNIELICADADNTPFINKIFDKVFAITILQNIPQTKKTITEIKRIGKLQAIFAITGLKKKFTIQKIIKLLEKANLKVISLDNNKRLKGYVILCKNI